MKALRMVTVTTILLVGLLAVVSSAANPVTVTFPVRSGEGPHWEEIARIFNAQSEDVKVETEMLSGNWFDYVEKVQVMVSSGVSPDIVTTALPSMPPLRMNGMLADLMPYLQRSGINTADYYPGVLEFFMTDGKLDLMPVGMNTTVSVINEEWFGNYGVALPSRDWEATWTWEDMAAYARLLTQAEGARFRSAAYTFYNSPTTWMPFVWGNGGRWLKDVDGIPQFALKEQPAAEAFEFLRDVIDVQETRLADVTEGSANFQLGNVAVHMTGSWWIKSDRELPPNVGLYPLPVGKTGPATGIATNPIGILTTSDHPEAAWKFIEWLHTREGSEYFVEAGAFGIPVYRPTADEHAGSHFAFRPSADAQTVISSMNYLRSEGVGPGFNEMFNIFRSGFTESVLQRNISVAEFLEQAEHQTNIVLREAYTQAQ